MARPQKLGLDYFPLDVDIDQDDKIQLVEALHGATGFAVVIKLMMRVYKEGYYYDWTEMEQLLFSRRVNVDINLLNDIVNDCIKYGLFNKDLYEKYRILSSHGIQERYFEASKRRKKITVVNQYLLIEESKIVNALINRVNVDINGEVVDGNAAESTQSKVKESKEENSKQQQTKEEEKKEPERKPVIVVDADFAKLTKFYSENIGPLNAAISDELNAMSEMLTAELALLALKESVLANANNKIKYTHSILKSWKSQNFKTAADVEQHEKRKEQLGQQKSNARRYGAPAREETIPEWYQARKQETRSQVEQTEAVSQNEIEAKRRELQAKLENMRRKNA